MWLEIPATVLNLSTIIPFANREETGTSESSGIRIEPKISLRVKNELGEQIEKMQMNYGNLKRYSVNVAPAAGLSGNLFLLILN